MRMDCGAASGLAATARRPHLAWVRAGEDYGYDHKVVSQAGEHGEGTDRPCIEKGEGGLEGGAHLGER
jgi:hypothetical protein